jgi:hypothetical protein
VTLPAGAARVRRCGSFGLPAAAERRLLIVSFVALVRVSGSGRGGGAAAAQVRSSTSVAAAASRAAPSAIRVICQPAMPLAVTTPDGRRDRRDPGGSV